MRAQPYETDRGPRIRPAPDPRSSPLFCPSLPSLVQTPETSDPVPPSLAQHPLTSLELAALDALDDERSKWRELTNARFLLLHLTPTEFDWHHAHWISHRARIIAALKSSGTSPKAIARFEACGSQSYLLVHKQDGTAKISASYCHHRMCQPCQRRRASIMADNLKAELLAKSHAVITLTLRSQDAPLSHQIDRLYRSFRKLRNNPTIKPKLHGGAAFLEVTLNPVTALWHPHLHVLAEASWIPWTDLRDAWFDATGDSDVCRINAVHGNEPAARELAKYCTKSLAPELFEDPARLEEYIVSTRGRRLCLTFGRWHGIRLSQPITEFKRHEWKVVCTLDELQTLVNEGNTWAQTIIRQLRPNPIKKPRPPPIAAPRLPWPKLQSAA